MFKKLALFGCLCLLVSTVTMKADTIGPSGCASCFGSSYSLTYTPTGPANTYDIKLVVNTTGYTGTSTNRLEAVAIKIVPNYSDFTFLTQLSAPATFTPPAANTLNANGCNGGTASGFICSFSVAGGVPVGGVYTFDYLVTSTNLLFGPSAASFKALYVDTTGKQAGITSENISLTAQTPEPSSLLLLATGLLGGAGVLKRRWVSRAE